VYVLVVLRGVDPPDQTGGGSLRPGLWGDRRPWSTLGGKIFLPEKYV